VGPLLFERKLLREAKPPPLLLGFFAVALGRALNSPSDLKS